MAVGTRSWWFLAISAFSAAAFATSYAVFCVRHGGTGAVILALAVATPLTVGAIGAYAILSLVSRAGKLGEVGVSWASVDVKVLLGALLCCAVGQLVLEGDTLRSWRPSIAPVFSLVVLVSALLLWVLARKGRRWQAPGWNRAWMAVALLLVAGCLVSCCVLMCGYGWPEDVLVGVFLVLIAMYILGWALRLLSVTKGEFDAYWPVESRGVNDGDGGSGA